MITLIEALSEGSTCFASARAQLQKFIQSVAGFIDADDATNHGWTVHRIHPTQATWHSQINWWSCQSAGEWHKLWRALGGAGDCRSQELVAAGRASHWAWVSGLGDQTFSWFPAIECFARFFLVAPSFC